MPVVFQTEMFFVSASASTSCDSLKGVVIGSRRPLRLIAIIEVGLYRGETGAQASRLHFYPAHGKWDACSSVAALCQHFETLPVAPLSPLTYNSTSPSI